MAKSKLIGFTVLFFYSATLFAQSCKPPAFTDPDRLKKIEATFLPVPAGSLIEDPAETEYFYMQNTY